MRLRLNLSIDEKAEAIKEAKESEWDQKLKAMGFELIGDQTVRVAVGNKSKLFLKRDKAAIQQWLNQAELDRMTQEMTDEWLQDLRSLT